MVPDAHCLSPPRTRARVGGTPGRTGFHPDAALRHPVRRFAGCRRHRLPVRHQLCRRVRAPGVFPFPRVCPAHGLCRLRSGPAVPARFTPHGIHRRPSGRLKPYPAGRNDQRRTWRSRVLALRPNPVLLRLAPYPGFAVRPQGAPVATGALRHALRIALGMGSVSGCHSRRLVFREEPYACHPPEITPIPLWRIFQNGVTPIATITHGTLSIRKLNAIKKGMPHTEHPRPAPCRDYR